MYIIDKAIGSLPSIWHLETVASDWRKVNLLNNRAGEEGEQKRGGLEQFGVPDLTSVQSLENSSCREITLQHIHGCLWPYQIGSTAGGLYKRAAVLF